MELKSKRARSREAREENPTGVSKQAGRASASSQKFSKLSPGYKQTEVGVIPKDWEVKSIDELGNIKTGPFGTLLKANEYSDREGIPLISVGEIGNGTFHIFEKTPLVPPIVTRRLPQYILRTGDIVFGRKGAVDRSALVTKKEDGWFLGSDGISIRLNCDCFPQYVAWQFQGSDVRTWLTQHAIGTTMASLNQGVLSRVQIPYAPIGEQRAIAEALIDVDGLLGALDQLIAKKRDLKQAAMQQLLTAKTRLPGFSDKWESRYLGEIGFLLKGSGIKKDDAQSGELPCIRYGEIYTHHDNYIKQFNSWISPKVASTATLLKRGDLLFAGSGETKEEIGKCVAFVNECEAYAGGDIVMLRPINIDSIFMGYYLNTAPINCQKSSRGQGDAVVHISATALSSITVRIPSLTEQTAIAAVLSDMDAELAALEQRRDKTRALKTAMMQELLTGKTRLMAATPKSAFQDNVIPFEESINTEKVKKTDHNWQINEAVVISILTKNYGSEKYPLGRKRYTKLSYLMHRHVEHAAPGYLKKAAGPYNPAVRYKGPESIAQRNGYIRPHKNGNYTGFVAAEKISQAEQYFEEWYGSNTLAWLSQFRYKSNDDLELLATVDMAMENLSKEGNAVDLDGVKTIIKNNPEWVPKLSRPVFSDANISRAILQCQILFPL